MAIVLIEAKAPEIAANSAGSITLLLSKVFLGTMIVDPGTTLGRILRPKNLRVDRVEPLGYTTKAIFETPSSEIPPAILRYLLKLFIEL